MKRLFFVLTIIMVVAVASLTAFAIEGDGTEETPFLITNQGELELVTDFPDCHFKLANDIELEGTWIPLCKQTSSGYFKGVFDGAGYTISNLVTDGSAGGLFMSNSGIIKNLNVIISDEGMTGTGAISNYNNGTITKCSVKGNILSESGDLGGICAVNQNIVEQCKFEGIVENTNDIIYGDVGIGGICGRNYSGSSVAECVVLGNINSKFRTGGICGSNNGKINDCYFIGQICSTYSKKGGIAGYSMGGSGSYAKIIDCYAVATYSNGGYGISGEADNSTYGYFNVTTSYYDKTISNLNATNNGTPKSSVAMKMKQTYANDWDFENVWGIDKNINNGYPYLLWEYSNVENENSYTINSLKITDLSGNELEEIPAEGFYFEINVTKNNNSKNADTLIIAVYDDKGSFIDLKYMRGVYYQNQTVTLGAMINKTDKKIGNVKAFVWNDVSGVIPLSNSLGITE